MTVQFDDRADESAGFTTAQKLALICRYYDGCSSGDEAAMLSTLHADVTHYFLSPNPGSVPVSGASQLADYWSRVQRRIEGRWIVDSIIGEGPEAVIEWTLFWTPPQTGERIATRGSEWYRFIDGLIFEIRAYYMQLDHTSELDRFDYQERRFSLLGAEASALHDPGTS